MNVAEQMTAIEVSQPGGPEVLTAVSRPVPVPGQDEVLIAVRAAGVNRPDAMQRMGNYPPPPGASDIPGLEIAGEIVGVGTGVDASRVGEQVCALVQGGGYAEYCVAPLALCLPIPASLDAVAAAGIPETFFTVWTNVFERGRLASGESILIHGGSSGIGTTAIQLARETGARVFVTAGTEAKCKACTELGADMAINYRSQNFAQCIADATAGAGVDVILDMVGGPYFADNVKSLAIEGRLVQIAVQQGFKVEMNLLAVMTKRLTITGSTLRPRSVAEKVPIADALRDRVWPMLESGRVAPVVHSTFPLAAASDAHALLDRSDHVGKIILTT
jgi:putative PIG3 family NAD(P)H quinone oxidoreductase